MESEFDIRSYLAIVRRRFLFLIAPALLIGAGSVAFAYLLPPSYESSATILVESQQIPTDLAAPTVTANAGERIQVIQQRLLARDNLLQIADKFGLYDYEGQQRSPTSIVANMRSAISISQIDVGSALARRNLDVIGFNVAFQYRSANISSQVTNELVSSILSQNISSRLTRASETSKFFEQQKNDIEQRLLQLEQKIANFKRANEVDLPETLDNRRAQLSQLTTQKGDIDQQIRVASVPGVLGVSGANAASVQQLNFSLKAKQLELDDLRTQRDELAPLAEKGYVAKNRMRDLDRQIAVAELNMESIQAQIAAQGGATNKEDTIKLLTAQRDELDAKIRALNESISRTPAVEVELNALNRDYVNLQSEYQQAQAKVQDASTGERLEQDRQAERFEVIEQATVPTTPSQPNRPRIIMAGSFGGVAAGVALVVLLEMLNRSIRTAADLERRLQLRPIASIPYITTAAERRRKWWRVSAFSVATIVIAAAILAAIHIYYLPLDVLWDLAWQRVRALLSARGLLG